MLNFLKGLYQRPFARKIGKYTLIAIAIYAVGVMFHTNYQFVNSNGLHGIAARATMRANADDHAKAQAYDTMPSYADYASMK